ncbi:UpxY family transcription antiterminator [Dinghuibacter silviterrae]|uniref:Transcription antitermination factor NusG n=1 Tax=Dinghuibacter silviterrae TaxID=1539049 RepID=A0A4R8DTX4_9BACT|nr:UpxY family transcription antiterminator [Dinghuibacter silviterrae]TDX01784.1 transcription antitermination factor NusG [Dinghuibacter silviterrae]
MNLIQGSGGAWYALYTRPRSEKKAAATLSARGITVYCPIQKVRKRWHDRYKIVEEPVFRSYVFVRIRPEERSAVLSDNNIITFVLHCGKPAVIQDREMEGVRTFLETYQDWELRVETNDRVRIDEGPFADYTGIIVRKTKKKASIRLELLNAYLVAEFNDTQYSKV